MKTRALAVVVLAGWLAAAQAQTYSNLHSFADVDDALAPSYGLVREGTTLFGASVAGGFDGGGTVFRVEADGADYEILHDFGGSEPDNGFFPGGPLSVSEGVIYGITRNGGTNNLGTIYRLATNGADFAVLHTFAGWPTDGRTPIGGLILSGSVLYGCTEDGGANDSGTIYRINTDGSEYAILHSFSGTWTNPSLTGFYPNGPLTLSGNILYGVTYGGGAANAGVVYALNVDGTGFTVLHSFSGELGEGASPRGTLVLSGTRLFGCTLDGGATAEDGVLFGVNTDGSGFEPLRSLPFRSDSLNFQTLGPLALSDDTIYGAALLGGAANLGQVFSIRTDGTDFTVLHEFAGAPSEGALPNGGLLLYGTTLYGMTYAGGLDDLGVIFSLTLPGSTAWDDGYEDLGGGWRRLAWFGDYAPAGDNWLWHGEHGWLYRVGDTPAGLWFWSDRLGWLWTSSTVYPFLWSDRLSVWLYYYLGSGDGTGGWFYNYGAAEAQWL